VRVRVRVRVCGLSLMSDTQFRFRVSRSMGYAGIYITQHQTHKREEVLNCPDMCSVLIKSGIRYTMKASTQRK